MHHFLSKFSFPSETLAYLDSIVSIVPPLASLWLLNVGSQREAKDIKLMKIISKLNISTTEHVPFSVKI